MEEGQGMNLELLPREEYYRPRRAAELRRTADRLDAFRRGFSRRWKGMVALAFLLCILAFLHAPHVSVGWVILTLFAVRRASAAVGAGIRRHLSKRADRLHAEAARLEAEHHSRYSELPSGEAS